MSSKKHTIQYRFNRSAAGSYDIHAQVQRSMANQLTESLSTWSGNSETERLDVLEIGCGTGALTEALFNEWSFATITAMDLAPAMIKAAENHVKLKSASTAGFFNCQPTQLRFLQEDIESWAADASTDSFNLIVSNACFQWLINPQQTLRHLQRMLHSGGLLLFTSFGPATFKELHESFNAVYRANGIEPQRHGLSFQASTEWYNMLKAAGFTAIVHKASIQIKRYASARDFLHSVKAMGASATEATAIRGLSSRRLFASMYKEYEERFGLEGGVAATYELQLIQANAPL